VRALVDIEGNALKIRRFSIWIAMFAALCLALPSVLGESQAVANSKTSSKRSAKKRSVDQQTKQKTKSKQGARKSTQSRSKRSSKKARKVCRVVNGKRRCKTTSGFDGHGVDVAKLRTEPLPRPSGNVWVYTVNFHEEVKVNIYGEDGELDDDALAQLDDHFRCRRSGERRAVDPRLYEILSIVYDHFGQKRIELVSAFRNQPNQGSRHYHASAMDIRIPGVSTRELYEFASSLDTGDMGIGRYPTSDFVHIDFRAPGEKSYRWTDYSGPESDKKKKRSKKKRRPHTS
jgi:uncharacterized protein YcbK (DUF882 family)